MAGVVDTSVLVAALHSDDSNHERAQEMIRNHSGIEVPPAILSEAELVIRKRAGLAEARDVLRTFLQANPQVGVMDADLHPDALRIWQAHGRLSYADAHAIAAALMLGDPLITLDRRQDAVWRKEAG